MGFAALGTRIINVIPDGAFARSGIRPGDRLEENAETQRLLRDQSLLDYHGTYHLIVRRGTKTFGASVAATTMSGWQFLSPLGAVQEIESTISFIVAIVLTSWLFVLRPSSMTFFLYLSSTAPPFLDFFAVRPLPPFGRTATEALVAALAGFAPWFLVMFSLRFPDNRTRTRGALAPSAVLVAALACAIVNIEGSFAGARGAIAEIYDLTSTWLAVSSYALVAIIMMIRLRATTGVDKARIRWAILGITLPLILQVIDTVANATKESALGYLEIFPPLATIAFYASVTYVLTRSRYIDPRFTLNRAAIFSLTGTLLVLAVSAVDSLTSRFLERQSLGRIVDATVAIGLGFFLHSAHRRIEPLVERAVFQEKHRAERRLRTIASSLAYATRDEIVEHALINDVVHELHITSAALFRKHPGNADFYVRSTAYGWDDECADTVDRNDQVVRLMHAERRSVDLHEWPLEVRSPVGLAGPRVAIPVLDSDELVAIGVYGIHRDHTDLDQSEIQLLCDLADRCSAAFTRIELHSLRGLAAPATSAPTTILVAPS